MIACEGAGLCVCGPAGLTKGTLAIATGADLLPLRAVEVGTVFRHVFAIILYAC